MRGPVGLKKQLCFLPLAAGATEPVGGLQHPLRLPVARAGWTTLDAGATENAVAFVGDDCAANHDGAGRAPGSAASAHGTRRRISYRCHIPLMLGFQITIPLDSPIKPYIFGRFGYEFLYEGFSDNTSDIEPVNNFYGNIGWQAGAGIKYALGTSSFIFLDFSYKGIEPNLFGNVKLLQYTRVVMSGVAIRAGLNLLMY